MKELDKEGRYGDPAEAPPELDERLRGLPIEDESKEPVGGENEPVRGKREGL